jgi:cytochrome b
MNVEKVKVWDIFVRLFHWSLVGLFATAWLTSESEWYRNIHINVGYAMGILIGLRILWGFVGTKYARWTDFIKGPIKTGEYIWSLFTRNPIHYTGHNPAGGWMIVLLLASAIGTIVTGMYMESGEVFEELHEGFASGMLALVGVHVLGVIVSGLKHKENLVKAMITGYKNKE